MCNSNCQDKTLLSFLEDAAVLTEGYKQSPSSRRINPQGNHLLQIYTSTAKVFLICHLLVSFKKSIEKSSLTAQ